MLSRTESLQELLQNPEQQQILEIPILFPALLQHSLNTDRRFILLLMTRK